MHEDVKKTGKLCYSKAQSKDRLKMESMQSTKSKKAYLNFEEFLSVVDVVI